MDVDKLDEVTRLRLLLAQKELEHLTELALTRAEVSDPGFAARRERALAEHRNLNGFIVKQWRIAATDLIDTETGVIRRGNPTAG